MDYRVYKLRFSGMVHFGNTRLEDAEYTFSADTLFSALCLEAVKAGDSDINRLYQLVSKGDLYFSDAFPYIGEELYLPKPFKHIDKEDESGDSNIKKAYKKLKYIPVSKFDKYLRGDFDPISDNSMRDFGRKQVKTSVSIRGEEEPKPYRVGMYSYNDNCGLYIIIGFHDPDDMNLIEELLLGLSYNGIGGKRSAGLGRFELIKDELKDGLKERLTRDGKIKMSLSVCLPKEDELPSAMEGAQYSLCKRSGFVQSDRYADDQVKKKDLYLFKSGSCFINTFHGDVYDVSSESGSHPVYRYAKPMFLEVDI